MLKRILAFLLDIIEVIVFAGAFFLFIYLLVMQPHKIKGASMMPNYIDGEYLLTDKVSYRFGEPDRGNVIIFEAPTGDGEEFIKRIIGLPGETVSLIGGNFFINSTKLNEPYLDESLYINPGAFLNEGGSVLVPENEYFVSGDNRPHSSDSRAWGFITKEKITGKAWFVYWPIKMVGVIKNPTYSF